MKTFTPCDQFGKVNGKSEPPSPDPDYKWTGASTFYGYGDEYDNKIKGYYKVVNVKDLDEVKVSNKKLLERLKNGELIRYNG